MPNTIARHNQKRMALRDRSIYVAKVKKYRKEMPIKEIVDKTVAVAIREELLDGFFKKHRGVVNVSLTEFNEEEFIANRRAEARAEYMEEIVIEMIKEGMSDEIIAKIAKCPLSTVIQIREEQMATV